VSFFSVFLVPVSEGEIFGAQLPRKKALCDDVCESTKNQKAAATVFVSVEFIAPRHPKQKFIQDLFLLSAQPCIIYFEFFLLSLSLSPTIFEN